MKLSLIPLLAAVTLGLSACTGTYLSDEAFAPKGQPESLLSASAEKVKFSIEGETSLEAISNWIEADSPTRAELSCDSDERGACANARSVLSMQNIPVDLVAGQGDQVVLVYERVVARPCKAQFISNHQNPFNLNHPSFGCATAMNSVQMVEDYRQFTSPAVSDPQDAEMAVRNIRRYQGINDPYYPY